MSSENIKKPTSHEQTEKPRSVSYVKNLMSNDFAKKSRSDNYAEKAAASDHVKKIIREANFQARGLQIPEGAAESFIEFALKDIPKKVLKSDDKDLIRRNFIKNLANYNRDLAYILRNYRDLL